jgi:hypothetical protein
MSSNAIIQGNVVRLTVVFTNEVEEPAEPSTVKCSIKQPNGIIETPTPLRDSLGAWHQDVLAVSPGRWEYRWSGTGVVVAAAESDFWVQNSDIV